MFVSLQGVVGGVTGIVTKPVEGMFLEICHSTTTLDSQIVVLMLTGVYLLPLSLSSFLSLPPSLRRGKEGGGSWFL